MFLTQAQKMTLIVQGSWRIRTTVTTTLSARQIGAPSHQVATNLSATTTTSADRLDVVATWASAKPACTMTTAQTISPPYRDPHTIHPTPPTEPQARLQILSPSTLPRPRVLQRNVNAKRRTQMHQSLRSGVPSRRRSARRTSSIVWSGSTSRGASRRGQTLHASSFAPYRFFMVDRKRNGQDLREEFQVLGSTGNVSAVLDASGARRV